MDWTLTFQPHEAYPSSFPHAMRIDRYWYPGRSSSSFDLPSLRTPTPLRKAVGIVSPSDLKSIRRNPVRPSRKPELAVGSLFPIRRQKHLICTRPDQRKHPTAKK